MVAVFILLLCGCSKEELYPQENAGNAVGAVLSLQVSADAYRSSAGTRASESELSTTFTNGDQLGVIVTYKGKTPEHFVYTYNGSAWTSSTPVYYDNKAGYAAYYPYRKELDGKSLADVKAAFTPLTDQSDYATGYAASDLMTCENPELNQTDKKLSISLTHAFSMLRMSTSDIPVKIKCADNKTYEYQLPGTDIAFRVGNTYYRAWVDNDGYARAIVPSSSGGNSGGGNSQITVESHYTVSGKRAKTASTVSPFASGKYYTITFPTTATDLGEYQLSDARMGDFYCVFSDESGTTTGFVFPQEAVSLPDDLKSSCIGIVMKAGKDNSGNWKDDCTYKQKDGSTAMSTIHGYVLALYDANGGSTCTWGSSGTQVNKTDMNREQNTGFYGYKNTQAIISFNDDKSGTLSSAFPAAYHASEGYETKYAAPANSSGWFLPSAGQCKYWLNNRYALLDSMKKATGENSYNWKGYYCSSSEGSSSPASDAWYANFGAGGVYGNLKGDANYVRACLAF